MMDGDKEAGEEAGSDDKSYDDGDVLTWLGWAWGGGREAGGSSILLTFTDKTGKVFNLFYELRAFITKLSVMFYDVSVK